MEQMLRDMIQEIQLILGSCLDNDEMERVIKEYFEKNKQKRGCLKS